jgi:hypothetical protein
MENPNELRNDIAAVMGRLCAQYEAPKVPTVALNLGFSNDGPM